MGGSPYKYGKDGGLGVLSSVSTLATKECLCVQGYVYSTLALESITLLELTVIG